MKALDLFSGIGGFSLGLERVGIKTKMFCEIDEYCGKVLKHHWPEVPIHLDIKTLNPLKYEYDLICGGFPCQDISTQGPGGGIEGKRSGLWKEFYRVVEKIQPKWVIIENVANLRSQGLGKILKDLWEIGYDSEWHILSAKAFGAPHLRERCFIIAYPECERFQGQRISEKPSDSEKDAYREASYALNAFREKQLPILCSRHDGVPDLVARDRLKSLGNSVIPQAAEFIGKQIMEWENKN